jgi:hypothetical protein
MAALNITPRTPVVGAKLSIVLDRDPRGYSPAQDGLYAIVIASSLAITPENPTPSQPPDAGFKLGDMVFVNGHGEFETVLQPTYGPNKYGTILTLAPGTQLNLSVSGPGFTRGTSLIIGAD